MLIERQPCRRARRKSGTWIGRSSKDIRGGKGQVSVSYYGDRGYLNNLDSGVSTEDLEKRSMEKVTDGGTLKRPRTSSDMVGDVETMGDVPVSKSARMGREGEPPIVPVKERRQRTTARMSTGGKPPVKQGEQSPTARTLTGGKEPVKERRPRTTARMSTGGKRPKRMTSEDVPVGVTEGGNKDTHDDDEDEGGPSATTAKWPRRGRYSSG